MQLKADSTAKKITDTGARGLEPPATGQHIYWCPRTDGFGVRVTANGARAWILERRVNGRTVRRTIGHVDGRNSISGDAARKIAAEVRAELQNGIDRIVTQQAERVARKTGEAEDALTLEVALVEYVKKKRRAKDGLTLKERTRDDYLAMVAGNRTTENGRPLADGPLFKLADKPLSKISADDVRGAHSGALKRSVRQATYAMQVLRAVLNWHGVTIPDSPLAKSTAGRDRIVLPPTSGKARPIQPERLGAWWRAACSAGKNAIGGTQAAADSYRFRLLTGVRGVEVKAIRVLDVDLQGGRVVLNDTKNRTDHTLLLSTQALAVIKPYCEGKKPGALVFDIADPRKTLRAINRAAGTSATGHELRDTFASVAEEIVTGYTLKKMLNHANSGDVTGTSYVGKSETQLRTAWQAVADFIETAA